MTGVFAIIGAKALWLLYLWLASCIVCSYLSARKGFGERPGLATAMLLSVIAVIVWLVVPPKPESAWKRAGVFGRPPPVEPAAPAAPES